MALTRFVLAAVGLAIAAPQEPAVPNVLIDHKPVDCVLAGQPPVLNACFTPPEEIVRARVYYRLGEAAWQFAPLAPEGSCFGAVLPRPTSNDATLRYYLEAVDLASQSTRSSEYRALVVQDQNACAGVMAAVRPGAATPAASAGKKKTLPIILIGAGAAGAGVALAAGGGGAADTTLTGSLPATVSSTIVSNTTLPEATTTTTTPGSSTSTLGSSTTTTSTTQPGSSTTTLTSSTTTTPGSTTTTLPASTTTTSPTTLPASTTTTLPCAFSISPTTAEFGLLGGQGSFTLSTAASCSWNLTSSQPSWLNPTTSSGSGTRVVNYTVGPLSLGTRVGNIFVNESPTTSIEVTQRLIGPVRPDPTVTSELAVPGGAAQIVWDGAAVTYAAEGSSAQLAPLGPGAHRVEAQLVSADGRPGTWRLSFAGRVKGLRPQTGKVEALAPDGITFRLSGRPGERVVFVFEVEP